MTISGSSTAYYGYSAASNVAMLCRNILGPADNFSASTVPALVDVERWLSSGCGIIHTRLSSLRYVVPIAEGTSLYDMISEANTLYGVSKTEMSRMNITVLPGERTRGMVFLAEFNDMMKSLATLDLSAIGGVKDSEGRPTLYTGGINQSEKEVRSQGKIAPRFARGMWKTPGTLTPSGTGSDNDDPTG